MLEVFVFLFLAFFKLPQPVVTPPSANPPTQNILLPTQLIEKQPGEYALQFSCLQPVIATTSSPTQPRPIPVAHALPAPKAADLANEVLQNILENEPGSLAVSTKPSPWKRNIVTTVFWVGEHACKANPVANTRSSWDYRWQRSFGGYDDPNQLARIDYRPAKFIPKQNPFYIALPYNDVTSRGTKAEAATVIPWFENGFQTPGHTVCKGRWVAIRHGNRVCYAQWEDVGPFLTDHWQYVFGNERPRHNLNHGAGLDVSPAVRDYLRLKDRDLTDWQFVNASEVPPGPWMQYGENNNLAIAARRMTVAN